MNRKRKPAQVRSIHKKEKCMNPWNSKCHSEYIALYIYYKGKRLPLCKNCWKSVASKDFGWQNSFDKI